MKKLLSICICILMLCSICFGANDGHYTATENPGPTISREQYLKEQKLIEESKKQKEELTKQTRADDGKLTAYDLPGPLQRVVAEEKLSQEEKKYNEDYPGRELRKENNKYYCLNSLGKKVRGWQQLDNNFDGTPEWYYFDVDYQLVVDDITPDGYLVDEEGKWVKSGNNAYDEETTGWKYGYPAQVKDAKDKKRYIYYKFEPGTSGADLKYAEWALIDDNNDGLYYWYYFDVDGFRVESDTLRFIDDQLVVGELSDMTGTPTLKTGTNYRFDSKGRWIDDNKVPVAVFKTANGIEASQTLDTEFQKRSKVLLGQGVILDIDGSRTGTANVIFGKKYSQLELFMRKIDLAKSTTNFEKEITDKNIHFRNSATGYYTILNCLYLKPRTTTIVVNVEGYRKISFDVGSEYDGRTNTLSTDQFTLLIYKDGVLLDELDTEAIYRQDNESGLYHWEDEWEKSDNVKYITLTFQTNLRSGLILTNGALTKYGKDEEDTYDVEDNDLNKTVYDKVKDS